MLWIICSTVSPGNGNINGSYGGIVWNANPRKAHNFRLEMNFWERFDSIAWFVQHIPPLHQVWYCVATALHVDHDPCGMTPCDDVLFLVLTLVLESHLHYYSHWHLCYCCWDAFLQTHQQIQLKSGKFRIESEIFLIVDQILMEISSYRHLELNHRKRQQAVAWVELTVNQTNAHSN